MSAHIRPTMCLRQINRYDVRDVRATVMTHVVASLFTSASLLLGLAYS